VSDDSYARWRARVPFSDEQFAAAYEADAEKLAASGHDYRAEFCRRRAAACRRGHVGRVDLFNVLDRLITKCNLCDKPALYRYGMFGRCRRHHTISTEGFALAKQRYNEITARQGEEIDESSTELKSREHAKSNRRAMRKRRR